LSDRQFNPCSWKTPAQPRFGTGDVIGKKQLPETVEEEKAAEHQYPNKLIISNDLLADHQGPFTENG
jgi:hypothetical protein